MTAKHDAPVFPIDGRIAGLWQMKQSEARLTVVFKPFTELTGGDQAQLAEEADKLSSFTGHEWVEVSFHDR